MTRAGWVATWVAAALAAARPLTAASPAYLSVAVASGKYAAAVDLNDGGRFGDGALHAFLYSSGRMRDLTAGYGVGSVKSSVP
jgi:hypothetical protein